MIVSDNRLTADITGTHSQTAAKSGTESTDALHAKAGAEGTQAGSLNGTQIPDETRMLARLLSENYSGGGDTYSSTIAKALKEAGLAQTPLNLSVASLLLDNGLSIGRDSIRNMLTGISSHPDTPARTLIDMAKAGIALTDDNVSLVRDFNEHSSIVSRDIGELADMIEGLLSDPAVPDALDSAIRSIVYETVTSAQESDANPSSALPGQNAPAAGDIPSEQTDPQAAGTQTATAPATARSAGESAAPSVPVSENEASPAALNAVQPQSASSAAPSGAADPVSGSISNIANAPSEEAEQAQAAAGTPEGQVNPATSAPALSGAVMHNAYASSEAAVPHQHSAPSYRIVTGTDKTLMSNDSQTSSQDGAFSRPSFTGPAQSQAYARLQPGASAPEPVNDAKALDSLWEDLSSANMESAQEAGGVFENAMEGSPDRTGLHRLLSDEFKAMSPAELKKALKNALSLSSGKLNKDGIKELYKRTYEFLDKLKNINDDSRTGQELSDRSSHAQKELETLYRLNQMYPHFELPLKLTDKDAEAGLYVYARNRGREQSKGTTALLHLNMPSLGQVDVHLKLDGRNLSARFYSEESVGALLQDNLPALNEKLEAKDYLLNASFSPASDLQSDTKDEEESPVIRLSNTSAPTPDTKYNFDTKA